MGALAGIVEGIRQSSTQDEKFIRDLLYFFELEVPPSIGQPGTTSFLLPLVLNPQEYSITEPFTVAETPTSGSGLYVEENGIIRREIKIRGHTGFKPQRYFGSNLAFLPPPEQGKSYSRYILHTAMAGKEAGVSGHRHFQFLQDAMRTYADLKRDPSTAKDTKLFFHVLKDDEHWRVIPKTFILSRSSGNRFLYNYEIDLLVVGTAEEKNLERSEDKGVFDVIKDAFRMCKSAIDLVTGIIQDLTALVDEIRRTVADIGKILSAASDVISSVADFVNGTASLIATPFKAATSVLTSLDSALDRINSAGSSFPSTVTNSIRQMQEAFHRIAAHPEAFQTPANAELAAIQSGQEISTSRTTEQLAAAAASASPNSFRAQLALGTANTPGDVLKARAELGIGRALTKYRSASEHVVQQGETLENLAASHLRDARKWRHIAVLNNLKAPYLSEEGLPGTKKIGDRILIPSFAKPPIQNAITPVIGASPSLSSEVRILGTDLALKPVKDTRDQYDLQVDVEKGSADLKLVSGVPNLEQGIISRLRTEKGRDLLYTELGMSRVVAIRIPAIDREMIQFRIAEAILADPRINAIRTLWLDAESADTVVADVEAIVVGFTGTTTLNVSVG